MFFFFVCTLLAAFLSSYSAGSFRSSYFSPLYPQLLSVSSQSGRFLKGSLRVNPHIHHRSRCEAYVTVPGVEIDVLVTGMRDRNRAFEGDTVAIEVGDRFFLFSSDGLFSFLFLFCFFYFFFVCFFSFYSLYFY